MQLLELNKIFKPSFIAFTSPGRRTDVYKAQSNCARIGCAGCTATRLGIQHDFESCWRATRLTDMPANSVETRVVVIILVMRYSSTIGLANRELDGWLRTILHLDVVLVRVRIEEYFTAASLLSREHNTIVASIRNGVRSRQGKKFSTSKGSLYS